MKACLFPLLAGLLLIGRLATGAEEEKQFEPPGNRAQPILLGGLPRLVHAFEDYDTDIEKRWWMVGTVQTDNAPKGSRRCCRAGRTKDFDKKMGDPAASYKAVIFNPVPGPPMGERPRLTFRYKLSGASAIRVQLYSLTNNYHRYLSLHDLPQNEWTTATVDMTQMRRPDGSGGPLAADERIDDIQFYIDPRADLLIDEMILYDEAPAGETRPFPRRILFTGWFDTGVQGNEWPGSFDIVLHEKPRTWDAARSMISKESGKPWIRLHLRGRRRLEENVNLRFQYKLTGAKEFDVSLVNSEKKQRKSAQIAADPGAWREAELRFEFNDAMTHADEIHFNLPAGAELLIDDLLLYAP